MATGLLLVDIQNDYFEGGNMTLVGMDAASDNAARLLESFRSDTRPLVHVQHLSVRPGSTFFVPDTEGVEIHAKVAPADDETLVQKNYPNAFRDTDLHAQLRDAGIDDLVICGAMSHMCIDATTRAAFDLGLSCTVIADACATRDLAFGGQTIAAAEVHGAFMAALSAPYAKVITTADYLES